MEEQNIHISQVVLHIVFVSILLVIGMPLQIKIIKRARQEKQVTWKTEIFHSIVLIIHFSFILIVDVLAFVIPDYTGGGWICLLSQFIRTFGILTISSHSLLISVQKYIVIVNCINDNSERHKLEIVSLVLYLTLSILSAAAISLRYFSSVPIYPSLENCITLGKWWGQTTGKNSDINQVTQSTTLATFCKFGHNNGNNNENRFIYFMTNLYCIAQTSVNAIIYFNIFEAFVYYKIFRFINR